MKCPQHYLMEMQEVILFYNGLEVPTRQILDSKGAIPTKTAVDAKVAIQEMAKYSQKWHNGTSKTRITKTSDGLAAIQAQLNNLGREIKKVNEKAYADQMGYEQSKRHEENSNLIKEIQAFINAAIRNQGASIKTLEIQIGQMSKVLQERKFRSLPSSTKTNTRDHVKSISTTVKADMTPIRRIGSPPNMPYRPNRTKESYGLQCLDTYSYRATRIDDSVPRKEKDPRSLGELAHTKLTVELADRTVKHPKGIAENVLVGIGTLVLNRSLDHLYGDYIELNDLNVPLELRRDQVDDLLPTIEEGEDKVEYEGKNVVGAFMNVPIFVRKFSIVTHFAVVENMDGYRDQDMGDVIFGEPFCKDSCVEARRFDGLIIIHNVIMEYLVKISKKARILELKRIHLKITVLTSNKPYLSRKLWRICACTSPKTTKDQGSIRRIQRSLYAVFKLW
ncbi:hypothetical protein Tco_0677978 [Tanacetum coccineum]|uniref:Uncharacterized protein n=1 Tax=Tanacetum coccineum TaxID=301880 RepID=A0ABQ4XDU3_9ASTR